MSVRAWIAIGKSKFPVARKNRKNKTASEALGCGNYDAAGTVTSIDVKMQITLPGLRVEIWESAPDRASFVTDGSHRGSLSQDLGAIDAQWTTQSTGQHGRLRLRAAPAAQCAPAGAA